MNRRRFRVSSVAVLLPGVFVAACSDAPEQRAASARASITGTYAWSGPAESGCALKVATQGGDSAQLQFDCTRGAPSYNSGLAEGVVHVVGDSATLSITEYGNPCALQLRFSADTIVVVQIGSDADCGFGYGVTADGRYARTASELPSFDRDR